jgi:predicted small secreted protein
MKGMQMNAKILLVLLSLAFGASTLTGCNTVQGAGKDVEKAGAKIQNEAQEHKTY